MNKKIIIIVSIFIIIVIFLIMFYNNKNTKNNNSKKNLNMSDEFNSKINIIINNNNFTATLEDNETSRAFLKMLPLQVSMTDLNNNEKYYYLSGKLPTNSLDVKIINSGDIMLFGSNCLVVFYESFNSNYQYTKIGKIDNPSSLKQVVGSENITVKFEK